MMLEHQQLLAQKQEVERMLAMREHRIGIAAAGDGSEPAGMHANGGGSAFAAVKSAPARAYKESVGLGFGAGALEYAGASVATHDPNRSANLDDDLGEFRGAF